MNYQTIQANLPMVKESQKIKISNKHDIERICQDLINLAQETFQIVTINSKNNLIDRHLVTIGLADACLVHPREVFRYAILDNAKAIICVHNHPSGDTTPSAEDVRITRQLTQAGRIIDMPVMDHVIIGQQDSIVNSCSMREAGLLDFSS